MEENRSTATESTFRIAGYLCMGVYFLLVIFPLGWILLSSMCVFSADCMVFCARWT